jgi:hypothetical protein
MNALESRYRRALKWYPAAWRLNNEEAMLGTLLDAAEGQDRATPRQLELANLAIHGMGSRIGHVPSTIPAAVRDRASTAALAIGAAIALTAAMQLEVPPDNPSQTIWAEYQTFGPFASPAIIIYSAWIIALFSGMAGFPTAARSFTLATVPLSFAIRVVADSQNMGLRPTWSFLGLLVLLAVLVAAGKPGSTRSSSRWLVGWFLPALLLFAMPQILRPSWFSYQEPLWLARPELISWSPLIAVLLAAALRMAGRSAWAVAALLIGLPFTAAALMGGVGISLETAQLSLGVAIAALGPVVLLRIFGIRLRVERVSRR